MTVKCENIYLKYFINNVMEFNFHNKIFKIMELKNK